MSLFRINHSCIVRDQVHHSPSTMDRRRREATWEQRFNAQPSTNHKTTDFLTPPSPTNKTNTGFLAVCTMKSAQSLARMKSQATLSGTTTNMKEGNKKTLSFASKNTTATNSNDKTKEKKEKVKRSRKKPKDKNCSLFREQFRGECSQSSSEFLPDGWYD